MNTGITNAVSAANDMAQYDEKAKRVLGHKIILAHILVETVEEFKGMNPKDVVEYIEGEPMIGIVSTEPGLTNEKIEVGSIDKESVNNKNTNGERITGMNTENTEINEGTIRFDVVFYVRMKNSLLKIIVNVEAQKDKPSGYHILNRAVFYACRLVSSQKERDFVGTRYDDIKQVYTIWICMNMPEDSTDYYYLTDKKVLGNCKWEGKQDILNIVLIGLAKELSRQDEKHELHRLLGTLFSSTLMPNEKLSIVEKEYDIRLHDFGKEVDVMCNLSQGIVDDTEERIIMNMHKNNFSLEQISVAIGKSIEEVEKIIAENKKVAI